MESIELIEKINASSEIEEINSSIAVVNKELADLQSAVVEYSKSVETLDTAYDCVAQFDRINAVKTFLVMLRKSKVQAAREC